MKTVVGLFNNFDDAQQTVRALRDAGFPKENISMIARDTNGDYTRYMEGTRAGDTRNIAPGTADTRANYDTNTNTDTGTNVGEGTAWGAGIGAVLGGLGGLLLGLGTLAIPGIGPVLAAGPLAGTLVGAGAGAVTGGIIGALVGLGIPEEQAHAYAEGIRRGGTLVVVRTADENADKASDIMNRFNPVDIDRTMQAWKQANWKGFNENEKPYTADQMEFNREAGVPVTGRDRDMDVEKDVTIPVVEERMNVGKREVPTGGVKVHTYVEQKPIEKEVNLRKEEVDVERRPVNRPATEADINAFKEGTMEFTEKEEKVVSEKKPFVVEEVHVEKDVENEPTTVRDTLREEHVEVEHFDEAAFNRAEPMFRRNFQDRFANWGGRYEDFRPAYRYGYGLGANQQYNNYDWNRLEPVAQKDWQRRGMTGNWNDYRDAVRYGWETYRGNRG